MEVPPVLKALKPYLAHAQQIGKHDPVVAYYCRYYAVLLGMEINKTASPEEKKQITGTLGAILDKLEAEKAKIRDQLATGGKEKVQDLAKKIFDQADAEDREGNATKVTARNFYAASIFISVSKQFYPDQTLDEEWEEKLRYAKWKAADITNAIKEGRAPTPGSASEQSELNSLLAGETLPGAPHPETAASVAASSLSSMDPLAALAALSVPNTTIQIPSTDANDHLSFPSAPSGQPPSSATHNAGPPPSSFGFPETPSFPPSHGVNPVFPPPSNTSANTTLFPSTHVNGSPNPSVPRSTINDRPAAPPPSKQPPPPQHSSAPPARAGHPISAPALTYDSLGVAPERIDRAAKHARYAQSALQFEDVSTAVKHLREALQELGYQ